MKPESAQANHGSGVAEWPARLHAGEEPRARHDGRSRVRQATLLQVLDDELVEQRWEAKLGRSQPQVDVDAPSPLPVIRKSSVRIISIFVSGMAQVRMIAPVTRSVPESKADGKLWEGTERAASAFPTVRKPALHARHDHTDSGHAYRAELTAYINEPVLSADPVLHHELELPDSWFATIRTTLSAIAATSTERTAVRQEWITRSVSQYTGQPAPEITEWGCPHGDFGTANRTAHGTLLDWEAWILASPHATTTSPCSTPTPTPNSSRKPPHTSIASSPRFSTAPPAGRPSWRSAPNYCNQLPAGITPT